MAFHVGQQVVCVDDRPYISWINDLNGLRSGVVYEVRRVDPTVVFVNGHKGGVWLVEIRRDRSEWGRSGDAPFASYRFRPVRKTDISIFTAMLSPAPKERADA